MSSDLSDAERRATERRAHDERRDDERRGAKPWVRDPNDPRGPERRNGQRRSGHDRREENAADLIVPDENDSFVDETSVAENDSLAA